MPPPQPSPAQQPKRVLRLIARLNVGGPAKHVAWLMGGLDPARFEQTLLAGRVGPQEDDLGPWLSEQGIAFETLPGLGRQLNPMQDLRALKGILQAMARVRPHLVATHTSKAGFLGRLTVLLYRPWARLRRWPVPRVVHTFHGHTFHSYFGPLGGRLFLGLERFMARRATDRIVVISPGQMEEIHHRYRVGTASQMALVPLGIDLAPFARPEAGRARFRAELGAGPDQVLIGAVGRVAPVKNYRLFVEVAARLAAQRPDLAGRCRFLLIGGGPAQEMAELEALAQAKGVEGLVSFLGNRDDPQDFFAGLDLLLLTSLNEGTPVSILEGGACGLAVAASDVGGVGDLLGPARRVLPGGFTLRQRGLTAGRDQAQGLTEALIWLLENPEKARELGQALKDYVWASHSKDRLVADIARLYDEVLSAG